MEIEHGRHWRKITTRPGSPQRDRVPKEDTRGSMGTKKATASKALCKLCCQESRVAGRSKGLDAKTHKTFVHKT